MANKLRILCLLALAAALALPVQAAPPLPLAEADLVFTFQNQVYTLGSPAEPLLAALKEAGMPLQETRADSCLFEGEDKDFAGEEFIIGTLPRGRQGADLLETIMVIAGDYTTSRGIAIGASRAEVEAAYGPPVLLDYDLMIYALLDPEDSPQVVFVMDMDTGLVDSYYYFLNTQE